MIVVLIIIAVLLLLLLIWKVILYCFERMLNPEVICKKITKLSFKDAIKNRTLFRQQFEASMFCIQYKLIEQQGLEDLGVDYFFHIEYYLYKNSLEYYLCQDFLKYCNQQKIPKKYKEVF